MKAFQKLALVSAIAALPAAGFAMQALDDATMSGVTGQDGININIGLNNLTANLYIEDTDGVADNAPVWTGLDNPGFLAITGTSLTTVNPTTSTSTGIDIAIDTGSATGGDGLLNIAVGIDYLGINGPISVGVAASTIGTGQERDAAAGLLRLPAAGDITEILSLGSLALENLDLNIQLGPDAAQFLSIGTSSALDIDMTNFSLTDSSASGGGGLSVEALRIQNIRLDGTTASITTAGLELTLGTTAGETISLAQMGVGLGGSITGGVFTPATAKLGNVYITGLQLGGTTLTISGK